MQLFYPKWFLDASGYFDSKPNRGPEVIMFKPSPYATRGSDGVSHGSLLLAITITAALACVLGYLYGRGKRRDASIFVNGHSYSSL